MHLVGRLLMGRRQHQQQSTRGRGGGPGRLGLSKGIQKQNSDVTTPNVGKLPPLEKTDEQEPPSDTRDVYTETLVKRSKDPYVTTVHPEPSVLFDCDDCNLHSSNTLDVYTEALVKRPKNLYNRPSRTKRTLWLG